MPELLAEAVYGLPELFREDLTGATLIAAAGCYPTRRPAWRSAPWCVGA